MEFSRSLVIQVCSIDPRFLIFSWPSLSFPPAAEARRYSDDSWAVKALVEITAISGPAPTEIAVSDNLSNVEPRALTTATKCAPCFFAALAAIKVSAVSPL